MGNFYVSVTLTTTMAEAIAATLRDANRTAFVMGAPDQMTVVLDQEADTQDPVVIDQVATLLSRTHRCTALAVLNHDDDILCYWLFDQGKLVDTYNSAPDYFDESIDPTRGGNATLLAGAFGVPEAAAEIDQILQGDAVFAVQMHGALADALKLPNYAVGAGYGYASEGEIPDDAPILIRVP